jgi:hypothetical protein
MPVQGAGDKMAEAVQHQQSAHTVHCTECMPAASTIVYGTTMPCLFYQRLSNKGQYTSSSPWRSAVAVSVCCPLPAAPAQASSQQQLPCSNPRCQLRSGTSNICTRCTGMPRFQVSKRVCHPSSFSCSCLPCLHSRVSRHNMLAHHRQSANLA